MSSKSPLKAITVDLTLNFNGTSVPLPQQGLNPPYRGKPLVCYAQSNGTVLSIVIGDTVALGPLPPTNVATPLAAATADITLVLEAKTAASWQNVDLPSVGKPLNFFATIDDQLQNLHLFVDDKQVPDSDVETSADVTFVLVQLPGSTDYAIHWLKDGQFTIDDVTQITTGSVVISEEIPPGANAPGSVQGPMGFSTP
jgi:hypothetical protein